MAGSATLPLFSSSRWRLCWPWSASRLKSLEAEMQHVIRDILDKQLVDARRRRIGKVDGLVLEARDDEPLRLAFIEVGAMTLGRRLHPRLERWAASIERWLGVGKGKPFR